MPLVIPLIVAGVAAAGSIAAAEIKSSNDAANAKAAIDASNAAIAGVQQANAAAAQKAIGGASAQTAIGAQADQSMMANNLTAGGGLNAQNAVLQGQQGLIGQQEQTAAQLQGVANGTGPNPAQAMLAQQTGNNVAAQGALMAGQRGASQNVGLMARQIGQQGAATQQNAVGQGATLQAQQSLGALGQLGTQQSAIGNTLNQAGGLSTQQVNQQLSAQQQASQTALQEQQIQTNALMGAAGNNTSAGVSGAQMASNANALLSQQQQQNLQQAMSGATAGAGAAITAAGTPSTPSATSAGTAAGYGATTTNANPASTPGDYSTLAYGGKVQKLAAGGKVGPQSMVGRHLYAHYKASEPSIPLAHGGPVKAMVSPGEKYIPPAEVKEVVKGKKKAIMAGEMIPGKAKVKGNNLKNDTVPKTLEEGGIVLPRTVVNAKDPAKAAAKFVAAIAAKQGLKKK